jgi:hypothetical protein
VNAAKNDRLGLSPRLNRLRQLKGITDKICVLDDFVALVEVAENDQSFAQHLLRSADATVKLGVRGILVLLR